MTTLEWTDKRAEMWKKSADYRRSQREFEVLTKEFCKKLTQAKNDSIISVKELGVMRARLIGKKTLEEVGRKFDVTRERIRMIEESVIEKMINI